MNKKNTKAFFVAGFVFALLYFVIACKAPVGPGGGKEGYYRVNYIDEDRTFGDTPADMKTYYSGSDTVTIMDVPENFYRVGYNFAGWNTQAGSTVVDYLPGDKFIIGYEDVNLHAVWNKVYPAVAAGENYSLVLKEDGTLLAAGNNGDGRMGINTVSTLSPVAAAGIVDSVDTGVFATIVKRKDGTFWGWGQNLYAQLGIGNTNSPITAPAEITGMPGVSALSMGRYHTIILTEDGSYWAAGSRYNGSSGDGAVANSYRTPQLPQAVAGFDNSGVVSVAAGYDYMMLVKSDGSLWGAGVTGDGRQGVPAAGNIPVLTQRIAMGNDNARVFTSKNNFSMVIKNDGSLWAAGDNISGQLGNNTVADQTGFVQVQETFVESGETITQPMINVAMVALGDEHSMILKNDGSLWAVGNNGGYRLGIFSDANRRTRAVKVMDNVAHVAAGLNHTLVVTSDGLLYAFGANGFGQLGTGNITVPGELTVINYPGSPETK